MAAIDQLNERQRRFVENFLKTGNATQSYHDAGYRPRSDADAAACASRLLRNVKVMTAIAEAQAARTERMEVSADQLLAEIDLLATSDIGDVLDFTGTEPRLRPACEIPPAARRAIAAIKVRRYTEGRGDDAREVEVTEFKLWNKLDALRLALLRRGLLVNKHEHSGKNGKPIEFIEVPGVLPTDRGSQPA